MEIEILKEWNNPLLERKELEILIKHPNQATPSKQMVIEEIAKKYNVEKDRILINYIMSKKGLAESFVKAKILKEPIKKVEKNEAPKSESK
ncbi:MAG: hypothetical protein B6U78_02575 [Candidatus Aenigmarchaeota archaeon ex4484_224]|nr:MAG: hypothetical protein B6U78_02575 [Candidatus Aenigmarchaeota archaeon ex4484_224]